MISQYELKSESGGGLMIPLLQLVLNPMQQVAILGCDFDLIDVEVGIAAGDKVIMKTEKVGKLSEQDDIFKQQLIMSMQRYGWDYDTFPNPEIGIVTII